MRFLACAGDDWDIACAVVRKARDMQLKERQEELKAVVTAVGNSVGNRVAEVFSGMFR